MKPDSHPTFGRPGDDRDRLARALDALRAEPVPEGPSPDVLARALRAVEAAEACAPPRPQSRRNAMFVTFKVAAAAVLAAGGMFLAGSPFLAGAPVSFREVAEKIRDAQTLSYTMTSQIADEAAIPLGKLLFKQPGHLRCESPGTPGGVAVVDFEAGKRIFLDPSRKTAVILEGRLAGEPKPGGQDLTAMAVQHIRGLAAAEGEALGEKKIGDVLAKGFRVVTKPGHETVVWVDPGTRLPIRVEMAVPLGSKVYRSTMSDIQLDPPLDDALFAVTPPPGYEVQKQDLGAGAAEKDDGTPEAALVAVLQNYAENSAGVFPKQIDDWKGYGEAIARKFVKGGKPNHAEVMKLATRIASLTSRAAAYLFTLDGQYGYKPDGIKLGDADKLLFWFKPKDKETWRGIYGDLHAADLPADKVPAR